MKTKVSCMRGVLEESENVKLQEVIRKKSKLKKKKLAHESLLSAENNCWASPRKVIEVKDNWVNTRATGAGSLERNKEKSLQQVEKGSKTCVRRPYHSNPWKECTGA